MKKVLIIVGILGAAAGAFFLLRPKKTTTAPTPHPGGNSTPPTGPGYTGSPQDAAHGQGDQTPPLPNLKPGAMVYINPSLTDSAPLFIYGTANANQTKVGSTRPSWYGTQPMGVFKAFSSDKKFAFVTFKDWQIWKGNGTEVGKITGDYFVPVASISSSPY